MEENEFRSMYANVNQQRCVYEKAINNRHCGCKKANRILIAGRECVGCNDERILPKCDQFLGLVRDKAVFAIQRVNINGPLPHNDELKVQAGGVLGLALQLGLMNEETGQGKVSQPIVAADISEVIQQASEAYPDQAGYPLGEIMQSITKYSVRRKTGKRKK